MPRRDSGPVRHGSASRAPHGVRAAAAWAIERTLATHAPVDTFLDSALTPFEPRDQGLLRELVLGTLRWLRRIDDVLLSASHRGLADIEPALLAPIRLAIYQLLFLDRVPAHAAVDEAVQHATHLTHRGGGSFANALLRSVARSPKLASWPVREADPTRRLAIELSHPDFLVERWIANFGRERAIAMLQANNEPKPLQLLAFRDRGGRERLAEDLIDEGLDVVPSSISPLGLTVRDGNPFATQAFRDGLFYVQDEASQVAALVPPPRAGERVLDAAAAPGGKTAALLAWESTIRVVAADRSLSRLATLRANVRRLRWPVRLLIGDATAPPFGGDGAARAFDRVVLDLPCSGTGTLRKHPELKWRISASEVGRLAAQGEAMLDGAVPSVVQGGLLIAITCSLEPEENELVVARFLSRHAEFRLLPLERLLPGALDRWVCGAGFWRLPTGRDHDGFTVHVMERRGTG